MSGTDRKLGGAEHGAGVAENGAGAEREVTERGAAVKEIGWSAERLFRRSRSAHAPLTCSAWYHQFTFYSLVYFTVLFINSSAITLTEHIAPTVGVNGNDIFNTLISRIYHSVILLSEYHSVNDIY